MLVPEGKMMKISARTGRMVRFLVLLIASTALLFPTGLSASPLSEQDDHQMYIPLVSHSPIDVYQQFLNGLGGQDNLFYVHGQLAFLGRGRQLVILDLAVPNHPNFLAKVQLPGEPTFLAVKDGFGYLALGDAGLGILDLRQPAHAYLINRIPLAGFSRHVMLADKAAFVSSDEALYVLDTSQPVAPRLLRSIPINAQSTQMHDSLLFVKGYSLSFAFYDISKLSAPVEVGHYDAPSSSVLAVTANYIYMKAWACGMHGCDDWIEIIDIRDPSQPVWSDSFHPLSETRNMLIEGDTAFITNAPYITTARIHPDGSLETLMNYMHGPADSILQMESNKLYVAGEESIEVIDVSNPGDVKAVGKYTSSSYVFGTSQTSLPYVYSRASQAGAMIGAAAVSLLSIDVSNPENPTLAGDSSFGSLNIQPALQADQVYLDGSRMYVTSPTGDYSGFFPVESIKIFDLQNPVFPVEVGEHLPGIPGQGVGVWFDGQSYDSVQIRDAIGYIITMGQDLEIVDLSNPEAPLVLSTFTTNNAKMVCLNGNYAYLVSSAYEYPNVILRFLTLDIADPRQPTLVSDYLISASPDIYRLAFDVSEGIAYLALPGILRLVDVSDPANPSELNVLPLDSEFAPSKIQVDGDLAVIGIENRMEIIDVSIPLSPSRLSVIEIGDWMDSLNRIGNNVYLSSGAGSSVLDITDPAQPRVVRHYPGYASSINTKPAYPIYLARYSSGLDIYKPYP
jgi:hypothetical protein